MKIMDCSQPPPPKIKAPIWDIAEYMIVWRTRAVCRRSKLHHNIFSIVICSRAVGVTHLVAVPRSTWISSSVDCDCAGPRAAPKNHSPEENMIDARAKTPERRRTHEDHSAATPAEDEGFVGSYKEAEPPYGLLMKAYNILIHLIKKSLLNLK